MRFSILVIVGLLINGSVMAEILRCTGYHEGVVRKFHQVDIVLTAKKTGDVAFIDEKGTKKLNAPWKSLMGIIEWTSPGWFSGERLNFVYNSNYNAGGFLTGYAMRRSDQFLILRVESGKKERQFRMHSTLKILASNIKGTCK